MVVVKITTGIKEFFMSHFEDYTVSELKEMPTLSQGQFANLKVDNGALRYWLTRMSPEDGQKFPVEVEKYNRKLGRWENVHEYGDWDEWREEEEPEEEEEPINEDDEPQEGDYTSEDHCKWYQYGK